MTREKDRTPKVRLADLVGDVGGLVDETRVTLGIHGPDVQPEEISAVLGCDATSAHRRGDARRLSPPYPEGAWLLTVEGTAPAGPEELVQQLLARLPDDPAVWERLTAQYIVRLSFGIFIGAWNRGFELSAASMKRLAGLGVGVGFDIYADGNEKDGDQSIG